MLFKKKKNEDEYIEEETQEETQEEVQEESQEESQDKTQDKTQDKAQDESLDETKDAETENTDSEDESSENQKKKKKKRQSDYYDRESYLNMLYEENEKAEEEKLKKKKKRSYDDEEGGQDYDDVDEEWLTREEKRERKKAAKKKKKEENRVKPEDVNIVRDLLNIIIYIGIVIIFCFLILTYVGQRTSVHGSSMNPTLEDGDNLWIDKISYRFKNPQRFDVIVFPYKGDSTGETYYIKRIIGLPGETIQIDVNGNIYIDGKYLDEASSGYNFDQISYNLIGVAANPITLGPDEYFVMGDNRNGSRDSRWADVGNIKKSDIIGRAAFRITPFKKFGNFEK